MQPNYGDTNGGAGRRMNRNQAIDEVADLLCDTFYRHALGPMEARQVATAILDRIGYPAHADPKGGQQ